jgi:GNAT superfamily N-acetyltransferase
MADAGILHVEPVTTARLDDLERFSQAHGRFRHCSCMRWRTSGADYQILGPQGRAAALAERVRAGQPVGVLAYLGGEPVGWCSVAPRESYIAVTRSRAIPTIEGQRVWSVVCFFLDPAVRGSKVRPRLLEAAVDYAAGSGAHIVEAYPWPGGASYFYMGPRELYASAGFHDVPVPDGARPVMRRELVPETAPEAASPRRARR